MEKKIFLILLILFISLLVIFKINRYEVSGGFFSETSIINGKYYLNDKNLDKKVEVSKIQWYFTNITGGLFHVIFIIFQIYFFYWNIRYGIPYIYHRKYENIYDKGVEKK